MRTTLAFLLGAILATLYWYPWSPAEDGDSGIKAGPTELEKAAPSEILPSAQSDLNRQSSEESVPAHHSQEDLPETAEGSVAEPSSDHDSDFFRNLKGAERAQYLAEHRWEYIETRRDSIVRRLKRLEEQGSHYDQHLVGRGLANMSVALLLDLQNRGRAWEPGVSETLDTGKDGWYSFMSSNWIYRVNEDEFPEIAYFHGKAPFELDHETGQKVYLPMNPEMLTLLHQRVNTALSLYEASAPQDEH